ncbi:MAG TPA: hypothetical protein VLD63_13610 [Anaerolineales bacterium]|nr:hypothetical protein [Anaerolineales bacterium]
MVASLALLAAAALSVLAVVALRGRLPSYPQEERVAVFGTYSPLLTWIKMAVNTRIDEATGLPSRSVLSASAGYVLELAAIGVWTLWVGRTLLDFRPVIWPAGREFGIDVYAFHFWEQLKQCGLCSLWNGGLNGGAPFLADPFTGYLHPLPALATLLAGVVNGAKITILASFFLAGLGQWWIAKVIGLSRWARVWTALMATSGAYLVGRVELGSVADPLSASAAILTLAAALDLALNRNRKAALRLALVLGLALLSGHGYYQLALIGWIPWVFLLILTPEGRPHPVWREFALAAALAVMVAAVFLVPFLHFWPQMQKGVDATFQESQPLEYIPINLVVHDWEFLSAPVLGKTPYPYLHTLFIGWPAVVLAVVALARARKADRRLLVALSLGALTMMWGASGEPMRWLVGWLPVLAGFRHIANIAAMAVPAILALAGYGLDRLLELDLPHVQVGLNTSNDRTRVSASLAWLLVIPIGWSLRTSEQFDRSFLVTIDRTGVYQGVGALSTSRLEWVSFPYGEHYWIEAGLGAGLKVTGVASPWAWKGRMQPPPRLVATRDPISDGRLPTAFLNEVPIYEDPSAEYAYVDVGSGAVPCAAQGNGGDIQVTCNSPGGHLVVRENGWTGWTATVNGQRAALEQGQWLAVDVPGGTVQVGFGYRPLDAALGVALSLAGLTLMTVLWIRSGRRPEVT